MIYHPGSRIIPKIGTHLRKDERCFNVASEVITNFKLIVEPGFYDVFLSEKPHLVFPQTQKEFVCYWGRHAGVGVNSANVSIRCFLRHATNKQVWLPLHQLQPQVYFTSKPFLSTNDIAAIIKFGKGYCVSAGGVLLYPQHCLNKVYIDTARQYFTVQSERHGSWVIENLVGTAVGKEDITERIDKAIWTQKLADPKLQILSMAEHLERLSGSGSAFVQQLLHNSVLTHIQT